MCKPFAASKYFYLLLGFLKNTEKYNIEKMFD